MSDLIVIAYAGENTAQEAMASMLQLQKDNHLELDDAVCVSKNRNESVKLHQSSRQTAKGATVGGVAGLVAGVLFLNPLLGAGVGAVVGGVAGKLRNTGIDDQFARQVSAQLKPDSSALIMLARQGTPQPVLDELAKYGGVVLKTSLTPADEAALQALIDPQSGPNP